MKDIAKKYLNTLEKDFKGLNLTKITDLDQFYTKMFEEVEIVCQESVLFRRKLEEIDYIIDIGFGGGFPLIPLALLNSEKTIIGIEATSKKIIAVEEIARQLEITNIIFINKRAEEIDFDLNCLLTFKAVGTVKKCLSFIHSEHLIEAFFFKGPNYLINEIEGINLDICDWEQRKLERFMLNNGNTTLLASFIKKKVPRGTINSRKKLAKLSSFI